MLDHLDTYKISIGLSRAFDRSVKHSPCLLMTSDISIWCIVSAKVLATEASKSGLGKVVDALKFQSLFPDHVLLVFQDHTSVNECRQTVNSPYESVLKSSG